MYGNDHSEIPEANPDTLACQFRKYGYQTAVIGKAHMVRRWDEDGFERIRYTDLAAGVTEHEEHDLDYTLHPTRTGARAKPTANAVSLPYNKQRIGFTDHERSE